MTNSLVSIILSTIFLHSFEVVGVPPLVVTTPAATETTQESTPLATETASVTPHSSLKARTRACNVFVGFDEPLYNHYQQNLTQLIGIAQNHINFANNIFAEQVFNEASSTNDVYFRLSRVQVMYGSCEGLEVAEKNCTEQREPYLKFFDRYDFREFCLAYTFTYRDFHNGTAGLAHIGTVCHSSFNSGFITLLNYGLERAQEDSYSTFVHELGHSFGAKHDEVKDDPDCQKGFIMSEIHDTAETLNMNNSNQFSTCSLESMKRKLGEISNDFQSCFKPIDYDAVLDLEISLCGNGIVDPGEECDCGLDYKDCNDMCCYPAHLDPYDRYLNKTAIPCARNQKFTCLYPSPLVFGVYVPFAFMATVLIVAGFLINRDYKGEKRCFRHFTHSQIKIVRP